MNYQALLASAVWALLRNKLRSILTVLGIMIGIAAVICVVAIGRAGQARVEAQLNNLGDNFVWIEAGGRAVNGVRTGTHATPTLTLGDALAIKNQVPLIKAVSPNVDASVQMVYGNQNWYASYRGVAPEYFDIKRWYVDQGAFFTQDDVDAARRRVRARTHRARPAVRRRRSRRQGDPRGGTAVQGRSPRSSPRDSRCRGRTRTTRSSCRTPR